MEKVKDLSQLKDLIKANKARFDRISKNNLLMLSEMENRILNGDVSFEWLEDGLLIIQDEKRYFNLYYYMNEGSRIPWIEADKPFLIEEAQTVSSIDNREREERILLSGFEVYKRNIQVIKELTLNDKHVTPLIDQEFVFKEFAYDDPQMQKYINEASQLWFSYLNNTDIPEAHLSVKPGDYLLCVYDCEGLLAATQWWNVKGRLSEGRHTVTIPQYYRRGIASALINRWCQSAVEHGATKAVTWISDKNTKSLNLYSKMGFKQSGKMINQYIRGGK